MKKIKNFYKNLTFTQGAVFALTSSSVIAIAAPIVGINVFSPGQTISSAAVNNNFNILKTTIEGMSSGQTYVGLYDASVNTPPPAGSAAGEYYIISVAGTYGADNYSVNDWTIWDGTDWGRIPNASLITSVFGRTGVIAPVEGDYSLNLLGDVNLTTPTPIAGSVLTYNGTEWRAQTIVETDPGVSSFAKMALPTCSGSEVLRSNGSTFTCVTDAIGAPYTGSPNMIMRTDGAGNLTTSGINTTVFGYLANVTSDIQTQLSDKVSAATFVDWMNPGVQTIAPSRINLTTFNRAVITDGTGAITTSAVTTTELGYLSGVTSSINTQFTNKANISSPTFTGSVTSPFYSASGGAPNNNAYRGSTAGTGLFFPSGTSLGLSTNGLEQLRILSNGNVGIGTTAPGARLDVGSTTDPTNIVNVNANNTGLAEFVANTNGTATIHMTSNNTGGPYQGLPDQAAGLIVGNPIPLVFSINSTERMRITSAGNVGIGITNPSYPLHVNGQVAGTSAYVTVSDSRYKKNILRIPNALEKILSIEGVTYNFKTDEFPDLKLSHRREMGVIAQKVENVFPEAVSKDQKGFRSVAYSMLISPIIEAIRSLDSKQKNLEAENKMLKNYLCTRDPMAPFCEE